MRGPQEPPPQKLFFNAVEKCEIFVEHVFLFPSCSRHPLALSSLALMLTLGKIYPQDRLAQPVAVQLRVVVGQEPEHPLAAAVHVCSAQLIRNRFMSSVHEELRELDAFMTAEAPSVQAD